MIKKKPSLTEKLKSLGVRVGTNSLEQGTSEKKFPIEKVVPGSYQDTPFGEAFIVESHYPPDHRQGSIGMKLETPLNTIATWVGDERLKDFKPEEMIFLDTETSGLSGGTGTYAFLIGIGHMTQTGFHLIQYFMRDPFEEPAQLAAFSSFLKDHHGLVTFNGKSFDVPILNTRFITNGEISPIKSNVHLDLLPLARRIWR
ncbi:MAG: ribonuclease H-like domain-containing protein, partial [Anaerolineales bacterium]